jgi:GGDEF domain-containing protein
MGSKAVIKGKMAMQTFDWVDPSRLDRRELHLWILALTVILVLAGGIALLMYPTVFYQPANGTGIPARGAFFWLCGLAALAVGYYVDRQVVLRHLRAVLENEKRQIAELRREASADLLTALPGPNIFRDRLAMEHRRASNAEQPLSLLTAELKPARALTDPGEIEIAFGEAAKTLLRKLRSEDSIFLFSPGVFGIFLPAVDSFGAYSVRDHLLEELHDTTGVGNRLIFNVSVFNFPEHVATAREMEDSVRRLLLPKASEDSNPEVVALALGIQ